MTLKVVTAMAVTAKSDTSAPQIPANNYSHIIVTLGGFFLNIHGLENGAILSKYVPAGRVHNLYTIRHFNNLTGYNNRAAGFHLQAECTVR